MNENTKRGRTSAQKSGARADTWSVLGDTITGLLEVDDLQPAARKALEAMRAAHERPFTRYRTLLGELASRMEDVRTYFDEGQSGRAKALLTDLMRIAWARAEDGWSAKERATGASLAASADRVHELVAEALSHHRARLPETVVLSAFRSALLELEELQERLAALDGMLHELRGRLGREENACPRP